MIDDCTRECLALVADTSLSGVRVARELDRMIRLYGKPDTIVSDNGTELTSRAILEWQNDRGVAWHYIAPGKPQQNGLVESFNARRDYNHVRLHSSQAGLLPLTRAGRLSYVAAPRPPRSPTLKQWTIKPKDSPNECGRRRAQTTFSIQARCPRGRRGARELEEREASCNSFRVD